VRQQLHRRLTLIERHREDHPRGFIRSLHVIRPDLDGGFQSDWFDLAEDCVLEDIGSIGPRLLLTLQAEDDRRVRVDAGGWRYLVGIGDGSEPEVTILDREQLRW
jgi:hypothetical protein